VAGIAIAAGYSVGRTGCWAVGDDYGRPFTGFLATQFPEGAPPSTVAIMSQQFHVAFPAGTNPTDVVSVYPTQLYETAMGFIMFAILWRFRAHTQKAGWLFGLYCLLAGIERFIVEFYRAKDDALSVGITSAQTIALTVGTVGIALLLVRRRPTTA
jgi:phosphatidylglycerol:prolipoprotein diacylglycerol transferase